MFGNGDTVPHVANEYYTRPEHIPMKTRKFRSKFIYFGTMNENNDRQYIVF